MKKKQRILVAMSGGVDSSVSAALLVEQGYDVTGAFMKQWSDNTLPQSSPTSGGGTTAVCPWKIDRRDALRVAAHLGIPLLTLDFEKEYKEWVMSYMFAEYEAGRTPNPDVLCNKYIKFGVWLDEATKRGFDALATGHYARVEKIKDKKQGTKSKEQGTRNTEQGIFRLMRAKDEEKDQTYFLHQLNQEQLSHIMFPVGDYTKKEVRALAKKYQLPTAERKESMGICFVGKVPMKEFLLQKIKMNKGNIVTTDGQIIGQHDGLAFYTIGQRHLGMNNVELGLPAGQAGMKSGETRALYVVGKRTQKNELVVGFDDDPAVYTREIAVTDMHWVAGRAPTFPLKCEVRLRHRQQLQIAKCRLQDDRLLIVCKQSQKAVTPGQFAVLYAKGECLGGGVII